VLDLGLAGLDGLEVTRRIRKESDVPILMLTARTGESDKLLGLEIGADDYVTKPFSTAELVARVRALLRRSSGVLAERALEMGELRIDPARRTVERRGERVTLTTLEFDLLYFLASRPGRVFSRDALMHQVWGSDRVVDDRSIDSLVSRLRRKLEEDPATPRYLQTVWGAGYRFAESTP
jgi:two-component system response regulator ResD